jgi:hypothetical protein
MARALRKIAVTPSKHPSRESGWLGVGLDDFGSVGQTSGVRMPADGADLRAAGEQLGNEWPSDVARGSGDHDHVNSLRLGVRS